MLHAHELSIEEGRVKRVLTFGLPPGQNDRNDDLEASLEALAEKATLDLALAIFQFHAIDRVIQVGKFPLFDCRAAQCASHLPD
ncbi:protein of unknown function [Pseudorhizobium banfieldiae]|uniref:Uncharacterized protein n=1 Tax=Pseudorhizobium banfieldiae TaxID=1125847 RepID=L0NDA8_9HYPH|nr:protein of unknown function [Pseudorhizobium banfieldiae]